MAVRRIDLVVTHACVAVPSQAFRQFALLIDGEEDVGLCTKDQRWMGGEPLQAAGE